MKLIIATGNQNKVREMREILTGHEVLSQAEAGILCDVEETGTTFEENAVLKASQICRLCNLPTIADDSGIVVDALGGAPGIYSARYAGEHATDEDRNKKLLDALKNVPDAQRTGRFVCAIAIVFPDGETHTFRGECEGLIARAPKGGHGFGYDPLFYYPPFGCTLGEADPAQKNKVSHRYRALQKLDAFLRGR